MTFNQWLILTYGQNWQGIHMDLIVEGLCEDELNDKYNERMEEFEEYMDLYELEIIAE